MRAKPSRKDMRRGKLMGELKLAHVGIVVKDIAAFAPVLREVLQVRTVISVVEDHNEGALLQMFHSGQTFLELIAK